MKRIWQRAILFLAAALLLGGVAFLWLIADLPTPDALQGRLHLPSIRITDRHGQLLYEALPEEGGRHTVLPLEQIPLACQQAAIATEDRYFYQNPGVDLIGIGRAVWIQIQGGEAGGSTITQQVARNLLLEAGERGERSLRRKLREAYLAWRLTGHYSKDEILGFYLNQTYYGGMAYGIEAAAQTFLGKPAQELSVAECALLAGLPQAPAVYNPFTDPEAAKERQRVVLGLLEAQGYLNQEQRQLAERQPLRFASTPYPIEAPHFVMMVRAEVDRLVAQDDVYAHGGLTVQTTLDLDWQRLAEKAVAQQVQKVKEDRQGMGHNLNSAALVALDPYSGEILALVGSPDYFDSDNGGAINMANTPRQPGSALKPLVYAAAFDPERSQPWTAATMILDVRATFATREGEPYTPVNYDGLEHGPVSARTALASSLNIPAVKALDFTGLPALVTLANRLGVGSLENPQDYDLSVALGGGDVRLLELTAAYGAFANGGFRLAPYAIEQIADPQGHVLYQHAAAALQRGLDERVAWLISDILSDPDARRLGFGRNSALQLDRPAAVKTGTTTNFHDNWTIGYTPDLVVGVWAGNTNYEPMHDITGLTGAAPIWHQFMRDALTGTPERAFTRPDGLARVEVCALSGLLPGEACPYLRQEWFIRGTEPTLTDHIYHNVTLDSASGRLADGSTPAERRIQALALDLPPEAGEWARQHGVLLLADLANPSAPLTEAGQTPATQPIWLLAPAANSTYRITASLPLESQRIRVEAAGVAGLRNITLWVDGEILATQETGPTVAWWQLEAGVHTFWAQAEIANALPTGGGNAQAHLTNTVVSERIEITVLAGPP